MKTNIQIKTIFGVIFGIFTTFLWGCKADLNPYEELESNEYIQLNFTKTETTRADIGEDGSGSFNEGGTVLVYISIMDQISNIVSSLLKEANGSQN